MAKPGSRNYLELVTRVSRQTWWNISTIHISDFCSSQNEIPGESNWPSLGHMSLVWLGENRAS
jgi:hypothetical protein